MTSTEDLALRVTHVLDAAPDRVFRAWTDPDEVKLWWGGANVEVIDVSVDLREGGRYRISLGGQINSVHIVGTYIEVHPNKRLVYTMSWEGADFAPGEMFVTVEFRERGDATELVLVQEQNQSGVIRDFHEAGWKISIDRLESIL